MQCSVVDQSNRGAEDRRGRTVWHNVALRLRVVNNRMCSAVNAWRRIIISMVVSVIVVMYSYSVSVQVSQRCVAVTTAAEALYFKTIGGAALSLKLLCGNAVYSL